MPENGFLQGLFLEEQLRASRKNQELQINASREAQDKSQELAREQAIAQQNQFMQQMGMRQRELLNDQDRQKFGQQLQLAQLMGQDTIRSTPAPAGLPAFNPMQLPTVTAQAPNAFNPQAVQLDNSPMAQEAPPVMAPTPTNLGPMTAPSQAVAPAGQIVRIGDQSFVIPSPTQRAEEGIQISQMQQQAATQQKIRTANELIAGIPDLTDAEKSDLMAQTLVGARPEKLSYQQLASKYMELWRSSPEPAQSAKYYKLMQQAHQMYLDGASASANARPQSPLPFMQADAMQWTGRIQKMAAEMAGPKATQAQVAAVQAQLTRDPRVISRIPENLRPYVEQFSQNSGNNQNIKPTIQDTINQFTGAPVPVNQTLIDKYMPKN
jgi:hypothetical protein